jgi:hypothetical protein
MKAVACPPPVSDVTHEKRQLAEKLGSYTLSQPGLGNVIAFGKVASNSFTGTPNTFTPVFVIVGVTVKD